MKRSFFLVFLFILSGTMALAEEGFIPSFRIEKDDLELFRLAQPNTYFDKVGRRFAVLGYESGSFEAWAYPLKILRSFEFSFLVRESTQPILAKEIVRFISVTPASTTLTFTYQSFTVKAIYITPLEEPGAIILLEVETTEPLTIVSSFIPVLQPMWPAGLGGQYSSWDKELRAYLISEPTRRNHAYVGSPAAEGISYTPAHMLSDTPNQFKIVIEKGEAAKGKFIPIILAGGKGNREDIRDVYRKLVANPEAYYRANVEHYRNLRKNTLQVETPEPKLNLAFEWAKVSFDNLIVDNPDLGRGMVAGLGPSGMGGRPGFGWFFGGDTFVNSLSLNSYGAYQASREAIAFTQKWQREDGKMAHELSQAASYIDWFKDYPYAYIHGDTSPYYILAMEDYIRMSGDQEFLKQSWPSLKRAYDWCLSTDSDGDYLMDNKKAGLGALEYGTLTGIQTDIYLAAIWIKAAYAMENLARVMGETSLAKKAAGDYKKAVKAFDKKFWDEENGWYSYAFNSEGKLIKEPTPWSAAGLMWRLGDPVHSFLSLEKINCAELSTDWGVRTLSPKSSLYEPLNYNYGAVWPFLSGWVATALFKHNFFLQGYATLESVVAHTFDNSLGHVTEVFSGSQNIWPQEAVPHQGFSSAAVILPFVRGLLGLEGDAEAKQIVFEPRFPGNWDKVNIKNYRLGKEPFSFRYERRESRINLEIQSPKTNSYSIRFSPVFSPGAKIRAVQVNGQSLSFKIVQSSQAVQPSFEFPLSGQELIEVDFDPAPEFLPPIWESKVGDSNKGLKIISIEWSESKLKIIVEGLAKKDYNLRLLNVELIADVTGAKLERDLLLIQFSDGQQGEWVRREIVLKIKK